MIKIIFKIDSNLDFKLVDSCIILKEKRLVIGDDIFIFRVYMFNKFCVR